MQRAHIITSHAAPSRITQGASKIQIAERNPRNMESVRSGVECFKHTPRQKKEEEKAVGR